MGPHIIIHVRGYASVMFLEGHMIYYLNFMFHQSSFTQVRLLRANRCPHLGSSSLAFPSQVQTIPQGLGNLGPQDPYLVGIAVGLL